MTERVLALDLGTVRIGVAASDPLGVFAQGIAVLPAEGPWLEKLDELMGAYAPGVLLVGLPVRTDGRRGPEAERVKEWTALLAGRYPGVRVELWDERYSTTIARRMLIEGDVSRKKRRTVVDKVAAAVILQSWLDRRQEKEGPQCFPKT